MKLKKLMVGFILVLFTLNITGCTEEKMDEKKEEEVKSNCTIVECMKQIEATNTIEEINDIIGFSSTTDAMIGSDPIWKFDSKNWITFKKYSDNDITIQATINKESIKDGKITLPSQSELQQLLNEGITYEGLVEKLGGEGNLSSKSQKSTSYTWVDKNGRRLGATINNESGKCTVASFS